MHSRDNIVISILSLILVGFGTWVLLPQLISGKFISALLRAPSFTVPLYTVSAAYVVAGLGLWFHKQWARWLAVALVGFTVIVVFVVMLDFVRVIGIQPHPRLLFEPEFTPSYIARIYWQSTAIVALGSSALVLLLSRHMGKALR